MLKTAIIGVRGYTGEELLKILLQHPKVEIKHLCARVDKDTPIAEVFPWLANRLDLPCTAGVNIEKISRDVDFVFLALPHGASMGYAPHFLKAGKKVIDLSADYRFKDVSIYEKWYETSHCDQDSVAQAVYGLCELNFEAIKQANLVANPGCYPTSAILALAPLLKNGLFQGKVIIDAKSGTSGAGKTPNANILFCEVNENFKAYKIHKHQHQPEISQELDRIAGAGIKLLFTPHLVPMNRGILSTIYVELNKEMTHKELMSVYNKFYSGKKFIRFYSAGQNPQIKDVAHSNFCDIGINVNGRDLILVCAIDNLVKGASGQAVQNMNIMAGLPETTGLL